MVFMKLLRMPRRLRAQFTAIAQCQSLAHQASRGELRRQAGDYFLHKRAGGLPNRPHHPFARLLVAALEQATGLDEARPEIGMEIVPHGVPEVP
jgi:hypothetical protein